MRLKSIKLAGFKSFVDATTALLPANLTAVVGPNGCGKSNIIDAVRWVMGESSARYLRGESMTDVIFNGSSARQPVGQAVIELVFDNSGGSAPGEFAQYNEISVRRRVTRAGQSDYFLNGTRCRRRDITDLFLGTGLGPRSYAIIEQGMISRLIEAKPEELRLYIEEAAGISKYKERRRETENRIRRTQENLERLTDLREELGRQVQRLQRQAQSAERYKVLKQEERQKKAELTALRWQALDQDLHQRQSKTRQTELELEKFLTGRVALETSLESLRESHYERTEQFNRTQARYYETGSDIARIEQSLQHLQERSRQSVVELDQALANQRETDRELEQDQQQLSGIHLEISTLQPEQQALTDNAETSAAALQQAEDAMAGWQQNWEHFNSRLADVRRQAELAQSRIRSLAEAIDQFITREERLHDEQSLLESQLVRKELDDLMEQTGIFKLQREDAQERIESITDGLQEAREQRRTLEQTVSANRQAVQTLQATIASQQTLLEEQMGSQDDGLQHWLIKHELMHLLRIGQQLEIEPDWVFAVEQVLERFSQGLSVHDLDSVSGAITGAPKGVVIVQESLAESVTIESAHQDSLLSKISNASGMTDYLKGISTANDLIEALARRSSLGAGESIVTRDGIWLSRDWIRMPDSGAGYAGIIERQRRLDALDREYDTAEVQLELSVRAFDQLQERVSTAETERDHGQQAVNAIDRELNGLRSKISGLQARSEQINERLRHIGDDVEDVRMQRDEHQQRLQDEHEEWQEALVATEEGEEEKERLQQQRDSLRDTLERLQQQARHDRDRAHQLQLQLQRLISQRDGLLQTIARMKIQKERLLERVEVLQEASESVHEPMEELQMQLEGLLNTRLAEVSKLGTARKALQQTDREVRTKEQGRSSIEQQIQEVRARLEALKLDSQALEIRAGNQLGQFGDLDVQLKDVLKQIPAEANESVWAEELEKTAARIQRLGAINLAAIEEYEVQNERKIYLDDQHEDLMEALETLDAAIRKIERKTRQRFKETFDQVNDGLQTLFPKVFDGGNAYLELTGEDLLETGVAIMARPPGKKNSTIHLLSGGEKALIAIALVFSIFQLNPAPFCMLDEVDAPLDDANVARYANMVKEMSDQVQFIYISHNKIAMEMADQLIGVTMHEPGCSRLVSVDVEAAAALAEA